MSAALRMELACDKVRVCIVEPGDTKTGFTASRVFSKACDDKSRYYARMKKSVARMEYGEQNGDSPDKVAKVICKLMEKKNPPFRKTVGYYALLLFAKRLLPERLVMWILGKMYG